MLPGNIKFSLKFAISSISAGNWWPNQGSRFLIKLRSVVQHVVIEWYYENYKFNYTLFSIIYKLYFVNLINWDVDLKKKKIIYF